MMKELDDEPDRITTDSAFIVDGLRVRYCETYDPATGMCACRRPMTTTNKKENP